MPPRRPGLGHRPPPAPSTAPAEAPCDPRTPSRVPRDRQALRSPGLDLGSPCSWAVGGARASPCTGIGFASRPSESTPRLEVPSEEETSPSTTTLGAPSSGERRTDISVSEGPREGEGARVPSVTDRQTRAGQGPGPGTEGHRAGRPNPQHPAHLSSTSTSLATLLDPLTFPA